MDWLTREQRSRNMASIRSRGNASTEKCLFSLLRIAGITGWRRHANLPGKPDFIFPSQHIVVFVDGCFWHGCPRCYRLPEDNRKYWSAKVVANRRRDASQTRHLRKRGWRVLRIWEHTLETSKGRMQVLSKLKTTLKSSSASQHSGSEKIRPLWDASGLRIGRPSARPKWARPRPRQENPAGIAR
jgi:DNA mismatch endonuclease, patch repair protein